MVSEYAGAGEFGAFMAAADRALAAARRAEDRARRVELEALGRSVAAVSWLLGESARQALVAFGYRRNRARKWSVRPMDPPKLLPLSAFARKRRRAAALWPDVEAATRGDKEALARLRHALRDDPDAFIEVGLGDLAATAVSTLAYRAANGSAGLDPLHMQAVEAKAQMLRDELRGPNPTAVEWMLADRAAVCWVAVYALEMERGAASDRRADFVDRQLTRAHNRFLSALRSLAAVRRLDLAPMTTVAVQVNAQGAGAVAVAVPTPEALPPPA